MTTMLIRRCDDSITTTITRNINSVEFATTDFSSRCMGVVVIFAVFWLIKKITLRLKSEHNDIEAGNWKLDRTVYRNSDQKEECSICWEDYKKDDKCCVLSECKHVFHQTCILTWLRLKDDCPLCRHIISHSKSEVA
ncbi:hypothetical protein ACFE04_015038 [Oxalis oulophora]